VVVTIFATILTHVVSAVIQTIKTSQQPQIKEIADEREVI
jgi:hypothetical protein